jgi:hypothetical protein
MRYVKQLAKTEKIIKPPPQLSIPEQPSEDSLPDDLKVLLEQRKNQGGIDRNSTIGK